MVLDNSALVALLFDEPEAEEFRAAVEEDTTRLVSAATLLESAWSSKRGRASLAGANSIP
jgi:ribonuclease VapC